MNLVGGTPRHSLARRRRDHRGHLANHGQDQALVALGKRRAVFLDFRKETNFILGKLAQHLLGVAVARRLGAREEIGQGNFHGLGDFGKSFQGGHRVSVFNTGKIAAQQPGPPFDIALRKPSLPPITTNDFPDIYFWFLFWHGLHTFQTRRYITQWSKSAQEVSSFSVQCSFHQ
jgi:hypothetical protein